MQILAKLTASFKLEIGGDKKHEHRVNRAFVIPHRPGVSRGKGKADNRVECHQRRVNYAD